MSPVIDTTSTTGKAPAVEQHVPLVVVGAGPAGVAAAVAAAKAGIRTLLVDENPIGGDLVALDVPLHFGRRANAAVQNKQRMIERIVESDPGLAEAFELGVDVQLGLGVWAAYVNGETVHSLPRPMLGLADDRRSWMVSFDRLIVAAGARDLGLAFEGWEKPGVMGVQAAWSLLTRYSALDARRLLILGSGAAGLGIASAAIDRGLDIAGIVEVDAAPRDPERLQRLSQSRGNIPLYTGHAVRAAKGGLEVEAALLTAVGSKGDPIAGSDRLVPCDTIVLALGAVPNIELLDILGCKLEFRSELGGHVPLVDATGQTSVPGVYAVGDCAGTHDEKLSDAARAVSEGRRAGLAAAISLGAAGDIADAPLGTLKRPLEIHSYWQRWSNAEVAASGWDVHVCQCEEVSRAELADLRPPRYLNWSPAKNAGHDLKRLASESSVNQDQVKRLTRAGMGPCQGRRCREQVQMLLSAVTDTPVGEIPRASYRGPVRPLPLSVLANFEESAAVRDNWVAWFNIPSQWTPHWEIDEAALTDGATKVAAADK